MITSPADRGARYCDESVCVSVCSLAYLKHDMFKLHEIFCTCYLALAQSFADDKAKRYVLPVLWTT